MYICICEGIKEKEIKEYIKENKNNDFKKLCLDINICNQCKKCSKNIKELINQEKII